MLSLWMNGIQFFSGCAWRVLALMTGGTVSPGGTSSGRSNRRGYMRRKPAGIFCVVVGSAIFDFNKMLVASQT